MDDTMPRETLLTLITLVAVMTACMGTFGLIAFIFRERRRPPED
jgi:hypothetical protein